MNCPLCGSTWVASARDATGREHRDCADCGRAWWADEEPLIRAAREGAAAIVAATPCRLCGEPVGAQWSLSAEGYAHEACEREDYVAQWCAARV